MKISGVWGRLGEELAKKITDIICSSQNNREKELQFFCRGRIPHTYFFDRYAAFANHGILYESIRTRSRCYCADTAQWIRSRLGLARP